MTVVWLKQAMVYSWISTRLAIMGLNCRPVCSHFQYGEQLCVCNGEIYGFEEAEKKSCQENMTFQE
ncbi:MAG: hypothetical protein ACLRUZ_12055 [Faecalimonas sp.]